MAEWVVYLGGCGYWIGFVLSAEPCPCVLPLSRFLERGVQGTGTCQRRYFCASFHVTDQSAPKVPRCGRRRHLLTWPNPTKNQLSSTNLEALLWCYQRYLQGVYRHSDARCGYLQIGGPGIGGQIPGGPDADGLPGDANSGACLLHSVEAALAWA